MLRLQPNQLTPKHRDLFKLDVPAGLLCFGVLDGNTAGIIFTDSADTPTWAVVREAAFGTLFPAGSVTKTILTTLVDEFRQQGDTLIGLWLDDPLLAILPDAPQYDGRVLDFTHRTIGNGLDSILNNVPDSCIVREMDADLHRQSLWYADRLQLHGSIERILEKEIAFALLLNGVLVSEASAGQVANGVLNMGTITHEAHRSKGYSTYISAYCIRECEKRGWQTYWNCNTANLPSVAIARKLGYQSEREYRLFGWFPSAG